MRASSSLAIHPLPGVKHYTFSPLQSGSEWLSNQQYGDPPTFFQKSEKDFARPRFALGGSKRSGSMTPLLL
jgi:hypothetical protein